MENWNPEKLREEIEAAHPVFLKLWKKGCGACKLSTPAIERIEAADQHGMRFGQICTDDHPEILEITEAEALPAFFVFREARLAGQFVGFKGLKALEEFVERAWA